MLNPEKIYFAKMNENAIIPSKREEDGAFDVYACFEDKVKILKPNETLLIPTGIASVFSSDYVAILKERGSTGSKGIGIRAGVIDSGYRGQWFVCITNHNLIHLVIAKNNTTPEEIQSALGVPKASPIALPFITYPYEKAIAQCVMAKVPRLATEEISYEELMAYESERGTGALGSSGK